MSSFPETIEPIKPLAYQAGDRYGSLMLTGKSFMSPRKPQGTERFVECICDCGKIFFTRLYGLKTKQTNSCGCGRVARFVKSNTTHGMGSMEGRHPLYAIWAEMNQRCTYPLHASYKNYGAIGVCVCEEWKNDFKAFFDWAIKNGWAVGMQLDKDILYNKKHGTKTGKIYSPEFCSFVTPKQNERSKSNSHLVTAFGETKCIADWADDSRCSISAHTLGTRISRGWGVEKAISEPLKK